jgi:hypothetical protein
MSYPQTSAVILSGVMKKSGNDHFFGHWEPSVSGLAHY